MSDSGSDTAPRLPTDYEQDTDQPSLAGPSTSAAATKRGTRACDRCRKIKSKCEPTEGDKCKNCLSAGTLCTYQGPSFKRGPPKGYIHAIEQRWHQVESILATVMASQRARDVFAELRHDPLARVILDRVESGPYGSVGRVEQTTHRTQDGLYNTIMTQSTQGVPQEDRRSKRQSRMTRELVSNQEPTMTVLPTPEWQEQLYHALTRRRPSDSPITPYSTGSVDLPRYLASGHESPSSVESHGPRAPARSRRKMNPTNQMYELQYHTSSEEPQEREGCDEAADGIGQLSVDEKQAIRYHGRSAGLHLLAESDRTDDHHQLKENGLWKFKMSSDQPDCQCLSFNQVNDRVKLPDIATQDHLITLYFAYVHNYFPIIHKASFLATYYERHLEEPTTRQSREPMQTVTKLLLLAMFSFAARYSPEVISDAQTHPREIPDAGNQYASDARRLLNTLYEDSRPSTCQALLLMGVREFGLGSLAQGWLYIGMGCRMAVDLGINRDGGQWKDAQGKELFSPVETQIRRQIWWSCCVADKLCSTWLGRPVMFKKGDFDTPEPDFDLNEDQELWRPHPRNALGEDFVPMPAHVMTCFRQQARLAFIINEIMTEVYPVKWQSNLPRRTVFEQLETSLQQWMINLPDPLRFHEGSDHLHPPPHVMVLHIEYYAALLLLNRAFLPSRHEASQEYAVDDVAHAKYLSVCQGAAVKISSLVSKFHSIFDLRRGPPFLLIFIQSAGIMHIVTLNRQPGDVQATTGLIQCIRAAEAMENVWPAAIRVKNLLQGVKVQLADLSTMSGGTTDRPKRRADEDLEDVVNYVLPPYDAYSQPYQQSVEGLNTSVAPFTQGSYSMTYPAPSPASASMTYVPGYEWWPQLMGPGTIGQTFAPDYQSTASHQAGLPHGMYSFDPETMPGFSSNGDPLNQNMAQSSHYHHSQHPQHPHGHYRK